MAVCSVRAMGAIVAILAAVGCSPSALSEEHCQARGLRLIEEHRPPVDLVGEPEGSPARDRAENFQRALDEFRADHPECVDPGATELPPSQRARD